MLGVLVLAAVAADVTERAVVHEKVEPHGQRIELQPALRSMMTWQFGQTRVFFSIQAAIFGSDATSQIRAW